MTRLWPNLGGRKEGNSKGWHGKGKKRRRKKVEEDGEGGERRREHGLEGLVSTRCDVYSFGITMIEAFTGKRPKDEMFKEELSIRRWIQELLPGFVDQVIDVKLLHLEDKQAEENKACVSSILQLALRCTSDVPENRINIKDAVTTLEKIKTQFFPRN
ncbi:probable LRR receptor-like serine/threonine-protein kinase At3g47570 [Coffea arabica]|uniref:Probable LRR receptor-like serine/threonine-protein kinase At3g47570 n=1 Tax=Coffea arabica TaxID=13443 RepID=A0ABM4W8Q7_COFAR